MSVPGIVFASHALLPDVAADQSLRQVANVATSPGVVGASYAMPDVHWGYGRDLRAQLARAGIGVRAPSDRGPAGEAPFGLRRERG